MRERSRGWRTPTRRDGPRDGIASLAWQLRRPTPGFGCCLPHGDGGGPRPVRPVLLRRQRSCRCNDDGDDDAAEEEEEEEEDEDVEEEAEDQVEEHEDKEEGEEEDADEEHDDDDDDQEDDPPPYSESLHRFVGLLEGPDCQSVRELILYDGHLDRHAGTVREDVERLLRDVVPAYRTLRKLAFASCAVDAPLLAVREDEEGFLGLATGDSDVNIACI
jgi:hypothetical protein